MSNYIRFIEDNNGDNVIPITHERAVFDSDGVNLETKFGATQDYTGADYTVEELDLENVPIQDFAVNANNTFTAGGHCAYYVEPGDVVKVIGGESNGLICFPSALNCPSSGLSVGANSKYITVAHGKMRYAKVPDWATILLWNTANGDTDVTPASITIYHPVSKDIDGELNGSAFRFIPCSRFSSSAGTLAYGAYSSYRNILVRVRGGHKYNAFPTTNATLAGMFLAELPRIGLTGVPLSLTINEATYYENSSIRLEPETDGYYFFRIYKSSSPSLNVDIVEDKELTSLGVSDRVSVTETLADKTAMDSMSFRRINPAQYTSRPYAILSENGRYGSASNYKHILVPVLPGQIVRIVKGVRNAVLAWFTSDEASVAKGVPAYVSGTTCFPFDGGLLRVPEGAAFLYVQMGASPFEYRPSYVGISEDSSRIPEIVRDNDYLRTKRILAQMVGQTRTEVSSEYKPLVLLHYSDIHGQDRCQERIDDFREFFGNYIDDTIQTGDIVADKFADDFIFGDRQKDILSVIGNHDTATGTGDSRVWRAKQGKDSYDRYIAPFVENWNVVQPYGAAENGYCFYYKDYTDSKVRLVVLDTWNNDATYNANQEAWLRDVLSNAVSNGLSVMIASHFRLKSEILLDSTFSKPNADVALPDSSGNNDPYIPIVKDFIDSGGELVCWICGHAHYDAITMTSEETRRQLCVCVGNASRWGSDNTLKVTNSMIVTDDSDFATFDLFNVMAVDTTYKIITLMRIGSHWDKYGRNIVTTCIKYTTGEVIR